MADIVDLIYADHDWLRKQFFLLDYAEGDNASLSAIWEALAMRLDAHADAEEEVFYPALLKRVPQSDAADETEDAVDDHNEIREAVAEARKHRPGSKVWFDAVGQARTENGKHLDEEEREAIPDFIKHSTAQVRHDLAMAWLAFYADHPGGKGARTRNRDVQGYIDHNS